MSVPLSSGAGVYRNLVMVQKRTGERGDAGELLDNWTDFKPARVGFEPVRGREFYAAGRISSETTHVVYMRYMAALTPDMRIKWGSRIFDIEAIINIDERNRELEITAIERFGQ